MMSKLLPNGNMGTGSIKHNPTPLQICLSLKKTNIYLRHSRLGIICTHNEGLRFRKSAAIAVVKNAKDAKDGLIQSVADINSPNGKLSNHSLAILLTQPERSKSTINTEKIRCISKLETTEPIDVDIKTHRYQRPMNVDMPKCSKGSVKPLKQLKL